MIISRRSRYQNILGPMGSVTSAGVVMPKRNFFSGGSGVGIDANDRGGEFGTWRGDPVDFITHFADNNSGALWYLPGVDPANSQAPARNFKGHLDLAIGGPSNASEFSSWAGGSKDADFRTMIRKLKGYRTLSGVLYSTSIAPMHEANGTWMDWSVTSSNLTQYGNIMKRFRTICKEEFPEALWGIALNGDSANTNVTPAQMWTAAGGADIVSVSRYNQYPHIGTAKNGNYITWESGSVMGSVDNPTGHERWRQYAAARGVPMQIREWANNGRDSDSNNAGDDSYFMPKLYTWLEANAGSGAGQVFGESYYNQPSIDDHRWSIFDPDGTVYQPLMAAAYREQHPVV